ncbi:MAG: T9SS type A sorting domain-containing protein [Saprospiraceae bacterium]
MKKSLPLIAVTLLFSTSLIAQIEWAPVGAKYYYTTWRSDFIHYIIEVTEVEVVGDTLIQGQSCRIFKQNSGVVWWNGPCEGNQFMYGENGRVYFYNSANQSFDLLYDFTKEPGESWEVPLCEQLCYEPDTLTVTVDSVTFTEINGIQVKTQYVTYTSGPFTRYDTIYNGIGSATQMYLVKEKCTTADQGITNLRCYQSPVLGVFNFLGEACDEITATGEVDAATIRIDVFPNPVSGYLNFQLEGVPVLKKAVFRIMDVYGKTLRTLESTTPQATQSVPVRDWPPGVYFLQYLEEGVVRVSEKFVKQ